MFVEDPQRKAPCWKIPRDLPDSYRCHDLGPLTMHASFKWGPPPHLLCRVSHTNLVDTPEPLSASRRWVLLIIIALYRALVYLEMLS